MSRPIHADGRRLPPAGARALALASTSLLAAAAALLPLGARAQSDGPTDPPYELCLEAERFGEAVSFPIEIDGRLEGDNESTRVDFYRFEAEPGLALRADMTDQATEPTTMANPLLGLFDDDCQRLDFNDDLVALGIDDSRDARLAFAVPEDGVFILAAAASPDVEFDGSSDDTGTYTLWIDRDPPLPLDAIEVTIARGDDDRIEVLFPEDVQTSGYNVYRDGDYITTVRPPDESTSFSFDGPTGDYCIVAFLDILDETRYSPCSATVSVGPGGLEAGPPSPPRELRAAVYSSGVAELFWEPAIDDGRIVAYRVLRDGIEVAYRDARSHFETGLKPALVYRYTVIAVDDVGNEGPPARLELRALRVGSVPPTAGDGLAPAPPGAFHGVIYSPGVIEIFWERSRDHARLAGYDVRRDGARVAFHKGASHFEPRLSTRRVHDFEVVAVDAEGNRSTPRRLRLEAGRFVPLDETPSTARITRDTYVDLVSHVFDIYVGELYSAPLLALEGLDQRMSDLRVSRDASDNPVRDVYACGDGRAELALTYSGTDAGEMYDWLFDACWHDGLLYDGTLSLRTGVRESVFRSTGLDVRREAAPVVAFSGTAVGSKNLPYLSGSTSSWGTTAFTLTSRTVDGDIAIEDATSVFAYGFEVTGDFRARLGGGFAVRSDASGGALLHASTPVVFRYERARDEPEGVGDAWNFTRGQLELVAEDGSYLLLDADTGDAATVRVTIDNEIGAEAFVTAWTPWQPRLRFDSDPRDAP